MAAFILTDATGITSNDLDAAQGFVDLAIIANDTGLGVGTTAGGRQPVTYARTVNGPPQLRLDTLVNTAFTPNYGSGASNVDSIVIAGLHGLVLADGTPMTNNGTALAPMGSGLPGASANPTASCLIIYDTQITACVARDGSGGTLDLPISSPLVLYHELSHAFRIVTNTALALTGVCNPSSPEENAAIVDENDLRTDLAARSGVTPTLRDPGNHCGRIAGECSSCCIIATLASRSLSSPQVQALRHARDHFVRGTEVGHAFFERFFHDYYAFSPQVCTIMAGRPSVSAQLLEGYIEPLLGFWKIMIERSRLPMDDVILGNAFMGLHADPVEAARRFDAIERTGVYWQRQRDEAGDVPERLLTLLRERAWPSDTMQWALVAPVRMVHALLSLQLGGADAVAIGREFNRLLDAWTPEVPLANVWAALSAAQVGRELAFCEDALLQSSTSRRRFWTRLRARFNDITAVAAVVDGRMAGEGA